MRIGLAGLLLFLVLPATSSAGDRLSPGDMLGDFTRAYSQVASRPDTVIVQFEIFSPDESWFVVSGDTAELHHGKHQAPAMTIRMSAATLRDIYYGRMTAFTAGAKASGADEALLELEFHSPMEDLRDSKGTMLEFIQHFFVTKRPERITLGQEHSRVVHGAHAIPLYYASGFRSAWYMVKDGQSLNQPGDTNPFPQAFVVISGRGRAKIGDAEVEVKGGESYFIPPGSDHVLWPAPGDSLVVIWLAWGEGA